MLRHRWLSGRWVLFQHRHMRYCRGLSTNCSSMYSVTPCWKRPSKADTSFSKLYLEGQCKDVDLFILHLRKDYSYFEKKRGKNILVKECSTSVSQNDCSPSYLRHARVCLCTKARSSLETPAFLAINLCKSDSSNISLFLAEPRGTLANMHAHNFSLTLFLSRPLFNDINRLKLW